MLLKHLPVSTSPSKSRGLGHFPLNGGRLVALRGENRDGTKTGAKVEPKMDKEGISRKSKREKEGKHAKVHFPKSEGP